MTASVGEKLILQKIVLPREVVKKSSRTFCHFVSTGATEKSLHSHRLITPYLYVHLDLPADEDGLLPPVQEIGARQGLFVGRDGG